ncbi:MAG: TetR/AcrR family transcriptional regulator [Thermomicrobiales bacterium]
MVDDVKPPTGSKVKPPRTYDASRRRAAAAETRTAVVNAANDLFLASGYRATTMSAIAERAQVAVDTIYATCGRKPDILRELLEGAISGEGAPIPALQRAYVQEMAALPDARAKLRRYARAIAEIQSRLAPLVRVLQDAATTDPSLARLWQEIAERRAANMRLLAADLAATGQLRPGLSIEEVADTIWATNGPELYTLLVLQRGWPADRFAHWLADAWIRLLLSPTANMDAAPDPESP